MCGNFTFLALSLTCQSPSVTQTVLQLGPPLVFVGGGVLFREHIGRMQWVGFATLLLGLACFFNTKLPLIFTEFGPQTHGVLYVALSACCFASFSLRLDTFLRWVVEAATRPFFILSVKIHHHVQEL